MNFGKVKLVGDIWVFFENYILFIISILKVVYFSVLKNLIGDLLSLWEINVISLNWNS